MSPILDEMRADPADGAPPFFSIVVPTYNRAQTIRRAIDSCLAQTFGAFETIVVDDGSSDGTDRIVGSYQDRRVRYLRQENAGAAAARNRGAAAAAGRYLAFLDSDDEFLPGKLQAFHDAIVAPGGDDGRTVWYSPLLFFRGAGVQTVKPPRAIRPDERVGDYLFADDGLMQTSTLVMPKALFARVRFDPALRNMQDLDLCLRLEAAGARFRMLPEPEVIWYDDAVDGRISYATRFDQVSAWIESRRELLSDRAYDGFRARYLALRLMRADPATALRLVGRGVQARSLSPFRAMSILVRGAFPGPYARMRDWLVGRFAGAPRGKS